MHFQLFLLLEFFVELNRVRYTKLTNQTQISGFVYMCFPDLGNEQCRKDSVKVILYCIQENATLLLSYFTITSCNGKTVNQQIKYSCAHTVLSHTNCPTDSSEGGFQEQVYSFRNSENLGNKNSCKPTANQVQARHLEHASWVFSCNLCQLGSTKASGRVD